MRYNPPAGSQDPDAKYVTGQPGKARGSAVPAEAVEHPQREIVEVIKQAGLEPSGDDLTHLWQALGALFRQKVPIATKEKAGIVKPGSGLSVGEDGTLDVTVSAAIPGTIVAFSGSFGGADGRHPIPLGGSEPDAAWLLCDGGSDGKGGTVPDLRGRMIMGASDAYAAGSTGGSATHAHRMSGTVGATTLSGAQLASHTHPISGFPSLGPGSNKLAMSIGGGAFDGLGEMQSMAVKGGGDERGAVTETYGDRCGGGWSGGAGSGALCFRIV